MTFTPSADVNATAAYIKESYAEVTVSANEGGTVKLVADGNESFDKIPAGSSFAVIANANAGSGYYVENITVTKNGEAIEPTDGAYGPAAEGGQYAVSVTFGRVTLAFRDGEVSLSDIFFKNYEAVEQGILKYAEITSEKLADNAQVRVEYVAYTILGMSVYEPLTYQNDTGHSFGTSEHGGSLKGGNTEKVRITVTLPDYHIELRSTAVMTVSDDRVETKPESSAESFTITYGDDLKAAVLDSLAVSRINDGEPVAFTADDFTVTARVIQTNNNYSVTVENATLTIKPQPIVVTINPAEKQEGDKDPVFTYKVTDTQGKKPGKLINLTLAREQGETPGTYRVYVAACNETNYVLDKEASADGVLTIKRKPYLLGDANGDGAVTVKDVTMIQRYLAEAAEVDPQAADVDGNGTVDIADATALQLYLAEKPVAYPIGQTIS